MIDTRGLVNNARNSEEGVLCVSKARRNRTLKGNRRTFWVDDTSKKRMTRGELNLLHSDLLENEAKFFPVFLDNL